MAFHSAGRRPTADVRRSTLATQSNKSSPAGRAGAARATASAARRVADFDLLIDRAIEAIRAAGDRADPVFGPFAELNSIVRAVTYHEGRLLEWGMARLVAENEALVLMPSETALPIVPAAVELLKRNDWLGLEGLRLRSEVHYKSSYVPDLFLVDRDQHSATIFDIKRSVASYAEPRLNTLRRRMMAAALIAGDWLHIEGRVAGVSKVNVAIIDGSNTRRDSAGGIFALDEIGALIGVPDAGEAMMELRANFALRVQAEVREACLRALGVGGNGSGSAAIGSDELGDGDDNNAEPPDDDIDDSDGSVDRVRSMRSRGERSGMIAQQRVERRPIFVGFARGSSP
jgi:hypothetical protein